MKTFEAVDPRATPNIGDVVTQQHDVRVSLLGENRDLSTDEEKELREQIKFATECKHTLEIHGEYYDNNGYDKTVKELDMGMQRGKRAFDELVLATLPLATQIVIESLGMSTPGENRPDCISKKKAEVLYSLNSPLANFDDRLSVATEALVKAATDYPQTRVASFKRLATRYITDALVKYAQEQETGGWYVDQKVVRQYKNTPEATRPKIRPPKDEDGVKDGEPFRGFHPDVVEAGRTTIPLEEIPTDTVTSTEETACFDPHDQLLPEEVEDAIHRALDGPYMLTERESCIIRLYYGFPYSYDGRENPYDVNHFTGNDSAIAQLLGISTSRVFVIRGKAMSKLHQPQRSGHVLDYLGVELYAPQGDMGPSTLAPITKGIPNTKPK